MPHELPIACSLSASEQPARLDEMTALGEAALLDVRTAERRAELRFAAAGDVRARVDGIVAAEAACCAFLTMTVTDEDGVVVLAIEAPDGAEPVLDEIVAAFSRRGAASAPRPA